MSGMRIFLKSISTSEIGYLDREFGVFISVALYNKGAKMKFKIDFKPIFWWYWMLIKMPWNRGIKLS